MKRRDNLYEGKKPLYVIGTLVILLAIIGTVIFFIDDDQNSALTGSTVIDTIKDENQEQQTNQAEQWKGSQRKEFNSGGKTITDFSLDDEINVGDYFVKVIGVRTMDKIGTYITSEQFKGKNANYLFYAVQVQITNKGQKEGYAPKDMFRLSDGQYEYLLDKEGTENFGQDSIFYPVLRNDVKRNIKIAFDVENGSYVLLVYGDAYKIYRMTIS